MWKRDKQRKQKNIRNKKQMSKKWTKKWKVSKSECSKMLQWTFWINNKKKKNTNQQIIYPQQQQQQHRETSVVVPCICWCHAIDCWQNSHVFQTNNEAQFQKVSFKNLWKYWKYWKTQKLHNKQTVKSVTKPKQTNKQQGKPFQWTDKLITAAKETATSRRKRDSVPQLLLSLLLLLLHVVHLSHPQNNNNFSNNHQQQQLTHHALLP